MFKTVKVLSIMAALILLAAGVYAQAPQTLMYQGKLTDATGPISTAVNVTFRIYDDITAGTLLWQETHAGLTPSANGVFTVELGSVVPFEPIVFDGTTRYLGIEVGSDGEMVPRQPITSVPYSMRSNVPGFANSYKTYAAVLDVMEADDTLEVMVPGPGYLVVEITGNLYASHTVGASNGWIVATIDTVAGTTDWRAWAWLSVDGELPSGGYASPYAATRVVQADTAGHYVFYLNTQWSNLNNGNIEESNFKAVYYPTHLGTEVPIPTAASATPAPLGPEAMRSDR